MNPKETWKPIPGWGPRYEASNLGRIRSNHGRGRVLRQRTDLVGYSLVNLYRGDGPKTQRVHRLIAEAFHPNPDGLPVVMHADNDKLNNAASNLRWGTQSENVAQAYRDGTNTPPATRRGSESHTSKLNETQVRVMLRCRQLGLKLREIGDVFGVHLTTVHGIVNRRGWAHVQQDTEVSR